MKLGATLARCLQTDTQVELCKIEHAAAIVSATPAPVDSWTTVACAVPVIESCSTCCRPLWSSWSLRSSTLGLTTRIFS
jgi:hypothetical protein